MSDQLWLDFDGPPAPAEVPAGTGGGDQDGRLPPEFDGASVLVRELARVAASRGRGRTVLVARTRGEGKELLRQVALRGQSWAGLEVTTVQPLATQTAMPRILRDGTVAADRFDEQAIAEQAIDDVISGTAGRFARFVNKVGFRDAVRRSVVALREGGVREGDLTPRVIGDREKQALVAEVLGRYEALLRKEKLVDSAGVLELALAALDDEPGLGAVGVGGQAVYLLPGLSDRGLAGRFVRALQRRGAVLLKTDPVEGLPAPRHLIWDVMPAEASGSWLHAVDRRPAHVAQGRLGEGPPRSDGDALPAGGGDLERIDLFAAASVYDELRGVLRRVLDRGARWDQVEIVTPDPATYGSALHALAGPIGISVNFAVGLPVERTRPGRVASAYFRWIENGFQEPVLRALVEAEDVKPPDPYGWIPGPRLARSLRRLRIGWGRTRYLAAVEDALEELPAASKRRYEDDEQFERRKLGTEKDLRALRALLAPVLAATPATSGEAEAGVVSPAHVAKGLKSLLAQVAPGTPTDGTARERLMSVLNRIEKTQTRLTDFASASNIVQGFLQISVPAPRAEGAAPWSAIPGTLHLSDFEHGGATGRPITFVVGMASTRFPGTVSEDPLLLDQERWRLGKGVLPLAKDRSTEARFLFAGLFARLRGEVAMSYCRWDPAEARALTPAPEMLQAYRLREGNGSLTFDDLERALGLAESRLPRPWIAGDVDASDVWLRALATDDGRLRSGLAAVGRFYPGLARGIEVDKALQSEQPSVHVGVLGAGSPPGANAAGSPYLDPFARLYSASALSTLGACPRQFLLKKVIRAKPPEDPEFDPGRWLDARQRGSLLHTVYQRTLHEVRKRGLVPEDDAFMALALAQVEEVGRQARADIPSPSAAVREWEIDALRDDARSFVEMIRDEPPKWLALERRFGFDEENVEFDTPAGSIQVVGAIDRVDDRPGGLRVVDYKTGSTFGYDSRSGTYDGGRRLQHVVYCRAASQLLGRRVDRMEYHFPTRRGENAVKLYEWDDLQHGGSLVAALLDGVSKGWFPATDDAKKDCRFCDYKEVCDVRESQWGDMSSRYADWTKRNLEEMEELAVLRRVRRWTKEAAFRG